MTHAVGLDVLIVGGGIAGLWLLDELCRKGYSVILVESLALGTGQTIGSQGILHSGFKHGVGGRQNAFIEALGQTVDVWDACFAGRREPDLRSVILRGDCCFSWRTDSLSSFAGQLGARFGLKSALRRVTKVECPLPLAHCPGEIYRLDERVVDPESLLGCLQHRNASNIVKAEIDEVGPLTPGIGRLVTLSSSDGSRRQTVCARHIVLTAGEGNPRLREICGLSSDVAQTLPLAILVISGRDLPVLNGFCLDGMKAKVVVTTQRFFATTVWQVASECIEQTEGHSFKASALTELHQALPGFAWPAISIDMYMARRAEAVTEDGSRSLDVRVLVEDAVITAWPTKLVLAPRLAQRIIELLPAPSPATQERPAFLEWPRPTVARYPWM